MLARLRGGEINHCEPSAITTTFSENKNDMNGGDTRNIPLVIAISLCSVLLINVIDNMETVPPPIAASTKLKKEFNLAFDESGVLRQVDPTEGLIIKGSKFDFNAFPNNQAKNQERYEAIGKLVDEILFEKLQEDPANLVKIPLDGGSFFFASPDWEKADKLMILIHGSGVVRAGQWARRLIINNSLKEGSQLPFVAKAKDDGYAVVVMNTNYNKDNSGKPLPGSETPIKHGISVMERLVKTQAQNVAIIAHSFGGIVTVELALKYPNFFLNRVFSIAFTDSVHANPIQTKNRELMTHLHKIALNYVASKDKLNTKIREAGSHDIPEVSAGHDTHEMTSFSAMEAIFERLSLQFQASKL